MYCGAPVTLTLAIPGGPTLDLMSELQGLRVASLDLGFPGIREDLVPNPDHPGVTDYTKLWDTRAVVIAGHVVPSPAGSRQAGWHLLAPFLNPAARPLLTYQIDGDVVAKTITVRASQFTSVADNASVSAFQVGFKAADPLAYDQNLQTGYVWPGPTSGRTYNLLFNRSYPAGGGTSVVTANHGDQDSRPVLRLYGPLTAVTVSWVPTPPGGATWAINFSSSYTVAAGNYVQIDCRARTVYLNGDPTQNAYPNIASMTGGWPYLPAGGSTAWVLGASGTGAQSQLQVSWQDAYLL